MKGYLKCKALGTRRKVIYDMSSVVSSVPILVVAFLLKRELL